MISDTNGNLVSTVWTWIVMPLVLVVMVLSLVGCETEGMNQAESARSLAGESAQVPGAQEILVGDRRPSQWAKVQEGRTMPELAGQTTQKVPPSSQGEEVLRLEVLVVHDPMVNNSRAFQMLIPEGWQVEGGVVWNFYFSNLATTAMRVSDPRSATALEFFPIHLFVWGQDVLGRDFPVGQIYLGDEVLPVIHDPQAFIEQVVLPRFRGHVNARVVGRQELAEIAQTVAASQPGTDVLAEKIRVQYREAGRPIEEDFYVVLGYAQNPWVPGITRWGPQYLYSFRAEQGELDRQAGLLQAMVASVTLDLRWFNKYLQVVDMWQQNQMQIILSAGELSRLIARTSDEISEIRRQAYENQQATYDRIYTNISKTIRGIEMYPHPFESRVVTLPSYYRYAWASAQGGYILTNDPGFDPNVGSTREWRLMEKPRH